MIVITSILYIPCMKKSNKTATVLSVKNLSLDNREKKFGFDMFSRFIPIWY